MQEEANIQRFERHIEEFTLSLVECKRMLEDRVFDILSTRIHNLIAAIRVSMQEIGRHNDEMSKELLFKVEFLGMFAEIISNDMKDEIIIELLDEVVQSPAYEGQERVNELTQTLESMTREEIGSYLSTLVLEIRDADEGTMEEDLYESDGDIELEFLGCHIEGSR